MKLNNKGVTLIELLISVVLVSIIMGFMYKLLLDVTNMQTNDSFATNNQLKRNEIIKTIENDLIDENVGQPTLSTSGSVTTITYNNSTNKSYSIKVYSDKIEYKKYNSLTQNNSTCFKTYTWTAKDCSYDFENASTSYIVDNSIYIGNIHINVFTDNDANSDCTGCKNNIIDDIDIHFVGKN